MEPTTAMIWRGLRPTPGKLIFVLAGVVPLVEGLHIYALGLTRSHARAALRQAMDKLATVDAQTVNATLDAFDRMTRDIFLATTGPYIVIALCIPPILVSLARLRNDLRNAERAIIDLRPNGKALAHNFFTAAGTASPN